jgi:Gram-negative bacterial TonB protein C-terminal
MKKLGLIALGLSFLGGFVVGGLGQDVARPTLVQPTLTAPGGTPFYLRAEITERGDPNEHIEVEMSWVAPNKWRRTIQSQEFSQTLIVNGDKVFEQDSEDYFPLGIQTLVTAMVDPNPVLDAVKPGNRVMTKANGLVDESGKMCFGPNSKMCMTTRNGLTEKVSAPGHSVDFMDYQKFKGERVARMLIYHIDPGDSLQARIMTLGELTRYDEGRFSIAESTSAQKQIRSVVVSEVELRDLALQPTEIMWPQVLDGAITGETSYYVSLDRSGQVREVLPLSVAIERADDSARRQIMKWKFKPVLKDGIPVQAEATLNFHFNTRAYGPAAPLTDLEARKLVSGMVDPVFPAGATSGSTFTIHLAVDEEGHVIESIAGDGPRELYRPCSQAVGKWRFSPILEDGKPRPYRAEIVCRAP